MNALDPIIELVRADLELRREQRDLEELESAARDRLAADPIRPWREALAAPESIARSAARAPSAIESAPAAAKIAAPALSTASSRAGPGSPARIFRAVSAFWAGSPPGIACWATLVSPTCSGVIE